MVDNQELETLSGSGKAVANLSIRIALGQVLTNRVVSLMLADEIDASMDDFRAEKTADVLQMLVERVSQVLLVSHKTVDAPHYVRLGDMND
jgi:DNA repair exonuclease SbcCD ATPase subunit